MDRREFLRATAATAVVARGAGLDAAAVRRPNVLYVFSDQHRASSMPGEPASPVIAPHLDAFRSSAFTMARATSNYPLCTPHRGMLLTGRWPYQSGITANGLPIRRNEVSLGRVFRDQGYHTAYVGKWHLQRGNAFIPAGPDRQGFDDWHVWERTNAHYRAFTYDPETGERVQPDGWNCTLMTDQAIALLKKRTPDKPWMMMVSWNPPHPPFDPPGEDQQRYQPATFPLRPNVKLSLEGQQATSIAHFLTSDAKLRQAMQGYYGAITGVDAEFGRLMAALEETGAADNTIVVYTSDHGEMMGSHGRMGKSAPFEESVQVPFYVRYPGVTPAGGRSAALFGSIDIYPTVCSLAGLPVPRHCAGRDFSALLKGGAAPAGQPVFLMNQPDGGDNDEGDAQGGGGKGGGGRRRRGGGIDARPADSHQELVTRPSFRGIRTETHTYAIADSGRWCLYDNVADPFQLKNLVADPAQRPLMAKLDGQIAAWLKEAEDPFPLAQHVKTISSALA